MPASDTAYHALCYGTISVDNFTHLAHLPTPKREAHALHEHDAVGGEALNVAIPLAAWGLRVLLTGNAIGTDRKGEMIMQQIARFPGIDTRYLQRQADVITPFTRVLVSPGDERSRITYWYDEAPQVELSDEMMSQAAILSVDGHRPQMRERAASIGRRLGRPVFSADAFWPQYPLAALSDVIILSRARLQAHFPGVYEYDHSLELQEHGAGVIIVTDNERPVLVVRADGSAFGVEPYEITDVVDTSAAGYVFKAGLIYAWNKPDWPLEQKVLFACAAAALSCRHEPAALYPPSLEDIAALMFEQPR